MDIVHIVLGKANPERMNGVNKVVYNLATKQKENGDNVSVWGITKDFEKNYAERNFNTKLFLKEKVPFFIPEKLKEEILKTPIETIYHLHGGWIPVFYSIGKFLKSHNRKFVFTPHGSYNSAAVKKNQLKKKFYFNFFEKSLLQNTKKIHCIGKSELDGVKKLYAKSSTTLIPYGFDANKNAVKIFEDKKIYFGYVGRLDIHTKGLDVMLEAFQIFCKHYPNAKLWIIGEGKDRKDLEELIQKYKLQNKVELFGSRFGEEKNVLIKQMDVFLHPSRNEGLPISVIEAANFGKPCIVSGYTNIGEQIEAYNAGIMFKDYNATQLFFAMYNLYEIWKDKNKFLEICNNAKNMIQHEYEWKKILTQLNSDLYGN